VNEASTICLRCIDGDPMHFDDDGWRGDCPYFLGLKNEDGTAQGCAYSCREEPRCQTDCPGIEPDGWGPNPNGDPCHECNGIGVIRNIIDTRPRPIPPRRQRGVTRPPVVWYL